MAKPGIRNVAAMISSSKIKSSKHIRLVPQFACPNHVCANSGSECCLAIKALANHVCKATPRPHVHDIITGCCRYDGKDSTISPKGHNIYLVKPVRLRKGDIARLIRAGLEGAAIGQQGREP